MSQKIIIVNEYTLRFLLLITVVMSAAFVGLTTWLIPINTIIAAGVGALGVMWLVRQIRMYRTVKAFIQRAKDQMIAEEAERELKRIIKAIDEAIEQEKQKNKDGG